MNPQISICVPTFNGEKYIRKCLESCVNQTFRDFEIIICDDVSTDATVLIIKEYQFRYPFVKFYQNSVNLGLVANWNKCLDLASGEWIKYLFQDDLMENNCLLRFHENFTPQVKLLVCRRNFVLDKQATLAEIDYYSSQVRTLENTGFYKSDFFSADMIIKLAAKNIALNFIAEPSLAIFRKDVIKTFGDFDPALKQICDLEFFLRIASNCGLTYIPEQLCSFTIHADSTTEKNINSKDFHQSHLESLIFAAKLLSKEGFEKLRVSLPMFELLKIKLYVKYKSYLAFKAINSIEDKSLYLNLQKQYPGLFFKKKDSFYLSLASRLKS